MNSCAHLVKLKTAVFMYKAYHCMLPENIQRNFVRKDVMHRTCTKQQLVRSCVSSNVRSMSLCVYGITLWNALKEYSSLQANPYTVRFIHTVLIVHTYFAPWGVDNVLISESIYYTACPLIAPGGCHDGTHLSMTS